MTKLAVVCFQLPDGRLVLQRRGKDAPTSPGKLGFFGGHVDPGETADEAIRREIAEETSLDPDTLTLELVKRVFLKADEDYPKDRHSSLYKSTIKDMNFEVFEGERAEAYYLDEISKRNDVNAGVRYLLKMAGEEI